MVRLHCLVTLLGAKVQSESFDLALSPLPSLLLDRAQVSESYSAAHDGTWPLERIALTLGTVLQPENVLACAGPKILESLLLPLWFSILPPQSFILPLRCCLLRLP
jgi:hypothetical protein